MCFTPMFLNDGLRLSVGTRLEGAKVELLCAWSSKTTDFSLLIARELKPAALLSTLDFV